MQATPLSITDWLQSNNRKSTNAVSNAKEYADYLRLELDSSGQLTPEIDQQIELNSFKYANDSGQLVGETDEERLKDYSAYRYTTRDVELVEQFGSTIDEPTRATMREYRDLESRYRSGDTTVAEPLQSLQDTISGVMSEDNIADARRSAVRHGDLLAATYLDKSGNLQIEAAPNIQEIDDNTLRDSIKNNAGTFDTRAYGLLKAKRSKIKGLEVTGFEYEKNKTGVTAIGEIVGSSSEVADLVDGIRTAQAGGFFQRTTEFLNIKDDEKELTDEAVRVISNVMPNDHNEEDVRKYLSDYLKITGDRPLDKDDPEKSFKVLSTGEVLSPTALLFNQKEHDKYVDKLNISSDSKDLVKKRRADQLDIMAPNIVQIASEADEEFATFFADSKAKGKSTSQAVEEWFSNEKNYSGFLNRAETIGRNVLYDGVLGLFLNPAAMLGSDSARNIIANNAKEQMANRKYAELFGDEFGLGMDIAANVIPIGVDIVTSLAAGAATAGVGAGAYLAGKTALKAGSRATLRNLMKSSGAEELAKLSLKEADDIVRGSISRKARLSAVKSLRESGTLRPTGVQIIKRVGEQAAQSAGYKTMYTSAFIRSGGSQFTSVYEALENSKNADGTPKYTEKEVYANALSAGLLSGLVTVSIMKGFEWMGLTGLESIANRGLTIQQVRGIWNKVRTGVDTAGKRLAGTADEATGSIISQTFEDTLKESIRKTSLNIIGAYAKQAGGELAEESIDEFTNSMVNDIFSRKDIDVAKALHSGFVAGAYGFAFGAVGGLRHVGISEKINGPQAITSEVSEVVSAQEQLYTPIADKLESAGLVQAAESIRRKLAVTKQTYVPVYRQVEAEADAQEQAAELARMTAEQQQRRNNVINKANQLNIPVTASLFKNIATQYGVQPQDITVEHLVKFSKEVIAKQEAEALRSGKTQERERIRQTAEQTASELGITLSKRVRRRIAAELGLSNPEAITAKHVRAYNDRVNKLQPVVEEEDKEAPDRFMLSNLIGRTVTYDNVRGVVIYNEESGRFEVEPNSGPAMEINGNGFSDYRTIGIESEQFQDSTEKRNRPLRGYQTASAANGVVILGNTSYDLPSNKDNIRFELTANGDVERISLFNIKRSDSDRVRDLVTVVNPEAVGEILAFYRKTDTTMLDALRTEATVVEQTPSLSELEASTANEKLFDSVFADIDETTAEIIDFVSTGDSRIGDTNSLVRNSDEFRKRFARYTDTQLLNAMEQIDNAIGKIGDNKLVATNASTKTQTNIGSWLSITQQQLNRAVETRDNTVKKQRAAASEAMRRERQQLGPFGIEIHTSEGGQLLMFPDEFATRPNETQENYDSRIANTLEGQTELFTLTLDQSVGTEQAVRMLQFARHIAEVADQNPAAYARLRLMSNDQDMPTNKARLVQIALDAVAASTSGQNVNTFIEKQIKSEYGRIDDAQAAKNMAGATGTFVNTTHQNAFDYFVAEKILPSEEALTDFLRAYGFGGQKYVSQFRKKLENKLGKTGLKTDYDMPKLFYGDTASKRPEGSKNSAAVMFDDFAARTAYTFANASNAALSLDPTANDKIAKATIARVRKLIASPLYAKTSKSVDVHFAKMRSEINVEAIVADVTADVNQQAVQVIADFNARQDKDFKPKRDTIDLFNRLMTDNGFSSIDELVNSNQYREQINMLAVRLGIKSPNTLPNDTLVKRLTQQLESGNGQLDLLSVTDSAIAAANARQLTDKQRAIVDSNRASNKAEIEKYGIGGNIASALQNIATNHPIARYRRAAQFLLRANQAGALNGVTLEFIDSPFDNFAAAYIRDGRRIVFNTARSNGRGAVDAYIHEMLHAATTHAINSPNTPELRAALEEINQIREIVMQRAYVYGEIDTKQIESAFSNNDEFIVYLFTDPKMNELVSRLGIDDSPLYKRIWRSILTLFGVKSDAALEDALAKIMSFGDMAIEQPYGEASGGALYALSKQEKELQIRKKTSQLDFLMSRLRNNELVNDYKSLRELGAVGSSVTDALNYMDGAYKATGLDPLSSDNINSNDMADVRSLFVAYITERMYREAVYASREPGKSSADWYTKEMTNAMAIAAEIWPEIADNAAAAKTALGSADHNKSLFTLLLALTSLNNNPENNSFSAAAAFQSYIDNGTIDINTAVGGKKDAIVDLLKRVNKIISNHKSGKVDFADVVEFLNREYTEGTATDKAKRIREDAAKLGLPPVKDNVAAGMRGKLYGSIVFGPKLGHGFYTNLRGVYDPVTIDMWVRRMYGRWTGDLRGDLKPSNVASLVANVLRGESFKTKLVTYVADTGQQQLIRGSVSFDIKGKIVVETEYSGRYTKTTLPVTAKQAVITSLNPKKKPVMDPRLAKALRGIRVTKQSTAKTKVVSVDYLVNEKRIESLFNSETESGQLYRGLLYNYVKALQSVWDKEFFKNKDLSGAFGKPESGKAAKPVWVSLAANIAKSIAAPTDSPTATQRSILEEAFNNVSEMLNIDPATLQALLWYPEKYLWDGLAGAGTKTDVSYGESMVRVATKRYARSENDIRSIIGERSAAPATPKNVLHAYASELGVQPQFLQDSLETARGLNIRGVDSETIRKLTGWFTSPYDRKLRWEISDKAASFISNDQLKQKMIDTYGGEAFMNLPFRKAVEYIKSDKFVRLSEIFDHPELYKAYPDAANIPFFPLGGNVQKGSFITGDDGTNFIIATLTTKENGRLISTESKKTLIHELQHFIQDKEGLPRGGSPNGLINSKDIADAAKVRDGSYVEQDEQRASLLAAINTVEDAYGKNWLNTNRNEGLFKLYTMIAGEQEANDVAYRSEFSDIAREKINPYSAANIGGGSIVLYSEANALADMEYEAAEKRGDVETANRLVEAAARAAGYDQVGHRAGVYRNGVPLMPNTTGGLGSAYYAIIGGSLEAVSPFAGVVVGPARKDPSLKARHGKVYINLGSKPLQLKHPTELTDWARSKGLMPSFEAWLDYQETVNSAYKKIGAERRGKDFNAQSDRIDMADSLEARRAGRLFRKSAESKIEERQRMLAQGYTEEYIQSIGLDRETVETSDANKLSSFLYDRGVITSQVIDWKRAAEIGMPSGDGRNFVEVAVANPEQIKSAEPFTYDENGNLIPLSQRFQATSPSIDYSVAADEETANLQPQTSAERMAVENMTAGRDARQVVAAVRLRDGDITVEDYARIIDKIDPFVKKGVETAPTEEKIREYIAGERGKKVMSPVEKGRNVEVRIDINTYTQSVKNGDDPVYAVTIHEPKDAKTKSVGKPLSYVPFTHVKNAKMIVRMISGSDKGGSIDIAVGRNKFPLATVAGEFISSTELPTDLANWTEVSYNPVRSSYFVDVVNRMPVIGADEVVNLGSRVYVKGNVKYADRPTGLVPRGSASGNINYSVAESLDNYGFYSKLEEVVAQKIQNNNSPQQVLATIRSAQVKPEEVKWSGVEQAVEQLAADNNGKVPKQALMKYLSTQGRMAFIEVSTGRNQIEEIASRYGYELAPYSTSDFYDIEGEYVDWQNLPSIMQDELDTVNEEKYSQYVLPDGDNYRELVLTMPEALPEAEEQYWVKNNLNQRTGPYTLEDANSLVDEFGGTVVKEFSRSDLKQANYTSSHFTATKNYVAHLRTNERYATDEKFGLFIEEIQSDRHQAGRKKGYKDPVAIRKAREELTSKIDSLRDILANKVGIDGESATMIARNAMAHLGVGSLPKGISMPWFRMRNEAAKATGDTQHDKFIIGTVKEVQEHIDKIEQLRKEIDSDKDKVADAPFSKSWPIAMFKRALRDAVQSGKDWIGWTDGDTQADRYDLSKRVDRIDWTTTPSGNRDVVIEPKDSNGFSFYVTPEGKVINRSGEASAGIVPDGSQIDTVLGEELADKILGNEEGDLSGADLQVGGSGMRGFYDNILPKEIGKYVGAWGAKVVKSNLKSTSVLSAWVYPNDDGSFDVKDKKDGADPDAKILRTFDSAEEAVQFAYTYRKPGPEFWRVDITPEMRESISTKGQQLYSVADELTKAYYGRIDRKQERGYTTPVPSSFRLSNPMSDTTSMYALADKGWSDQIDYTVPFMSVATPLGDAEGFWSNLSSRMTDNMPAELRNLVNNRNAGIATIGYDIERWVNNFQKLFKKAGQSISVADVNEALGGLEDTIDENQRKQAAQVAENARTALATADPNARPSELQDEYDKAYYSFIAPLRKSNNASRIKRAGIALDKIRTTGNPQLADLIIEMRGLIDAESEQISKGIGSKMSAVIDDNLGLYLTRTYKFFTSEAWAKAAFDGKSGNVKDAAGNPVDFHKLRADAAGEYRQQVMDEAARKGIQLTPEQVDEKTIEKLDNYLHALTSEGGMLTGASIRQELSSLMPRTGLNDKFKALLGMETEPMKVAARALHRVAMMNVNEAFTNEAANFLLQTGSATYDAVDARNKGFVEVFTKNTNNKAYGDLSGLYVEPKIAAALQAEFGSDGKSMMRETQKMLGSAGKVLSYISGVSLTAKTLGSIGFYTRNFVSSRLFFMPMQGFFAGSNTMEAYTLAKNAFFTGKTDADRADSVRRLISLGIVRDEAQGRAIMDLFRGFAESPQGALDRQLDALDKATNGSVSAAGKVLGLGADTLAWLAKTGGNLNNLMDSAIKIEAFLNERATLEKAGIPEGELDNMASDIVKRTFPTHSQMYPIIRSFNSSTAALMIAPFARFKGETVRVFINTWKQAYSEIKSKNPVIVNRGIRRALGATFTTTAMSTALALAYSAAFEALAGDDEEKDGKFKPLKGDAGHAIRSALPKYQRGNSVLLKIGNESIAVLDMTYVNPFSLVVDPTKLLAKAFTGEADTKMFMNYIVNQLIGEQIAAGTAAELANNKDDNGNPIWLDTDDIGEATRKGIAHYLHGAVEPAVWTKGVQFVDQIKQDRVGTASEIVLGELIGARPRRFSNEDIAYRSMRDIKNVLDDARRQRAKLNTGRPLTDDDVTQIIRDYHNDDDAVQRELRRRLLGLESAGLSPEMVREKADVAGFSAQRIADAEEGFNARWLGGKSFFKELAAKISNDEVLKERERQITDALSDVDEMIEID